MITKMPIDIKINNIAYAFSFIIRIFAPNTTGMEGNIELIKGIHPGSILERELKKRSLAKGRFALSIGEFPQTLGAIINGKRRMNPVLSLKIEEALNIEEGYFMVLQAYYDIKQEKLKRATTPDISKFRPALFWDTDIKTINWQEYKESIIRRVFERGNDNEQAEIKRFYSEDVVNSVLLTIQPNHYRYEATL